MKTVKISALSAAILLSGFVSSAAWSAASETVIIGLAGPLTGPSARIGKDLENGAQLAIDDINKQHPTIGGKAVTFKLQSEDDQSDPRTAVAVAQRLVDSGVAGVVGHWNTGTSIPAARVYHDAGIAQVAPVATGHAYTKQGFDTSFRVMGHDDDGGQFAGQYAVQTLKAKRIAVIDDRTAFGQGLADEFIKSLEAQGINIVDRQYVDDKTVDFSAVLTAIRSKNADLIFFGEPGKDGKRRPYNFNKVWLDIKRSVGCADFRFHDLRHEAVSRFVEAGLSDQEVSAISGHKSMQMLKRYTHLRAEDLVGRLDNLANQSGTRNRAPSANRREN